MWRTLRNKMAAPCRCATRLATKGFYQVLAQQWTPATIRASLTCLYNTQTVAQRRHLSNMNVEPQRAGVSHKTTEQNNKTDSKINPEEGEDDEPEYIPKRKAKNPMMKIGYAWMIGLPTGIIGFILAKREVDKNRLKQLRIRQRMKKANEGEYESGRYRTISKME